MTDIAAALTMLDVVIKANGARVEAYETVRLHEAACDMLENRTFPKPSEEQITDERLQLDDAFTAYYKARAYEREALAVYALLAHFCE